MQPISSRKGKIGGTTRFQRSINRPVTRRLVQEDPFASKLVAMIEWAWKKLPKVRARHSLVKIINSEIEDLLK